MKNLRTLLSILAVSIFLLACESDDENDPVSGNCPAGKVCFKLNGADVQVNAVWYDINGQRTRIYYENGSGANYENIEIDFYGSSTGDYPIVGQNWSSGDASFQFFKANGSGGFSGSSGTIKISQKSSTISGTFTASGKDAQGNTVQVTDGVINQVPAE